MYWVKVLFALQGFFLKYKKNDIFQIECKSVEKNKSILTFLETKKLSIWRYDLHFGFARTQYYVTMYTLVILYIYLVVILDSHRFACSRTFSTAKIIKYYDRR